MRAVELTGFDGIDSLRLSDVETPRPGAGEVLIQVRAAGINFAELEQTLGRYPFTRPLPGVLGFEAAGEVVELGGGREALGGPDRRWHESSPETNRSGGELQTNSRGMA